MHVIVRDQLIDRQHANIIDMEDRGYQFGDGVYEVIRLYNGIFYTYEEHMERLFASAAKIDLTIPYSKSKLRHLMEQLTRANHIQTGNIYLQVSRGVQQPRNHVIPEDSPLVGVLTASATEVPRKQKLFVEGGQAIIEPDKRWLQCDIKSISLLGNVLAKNRAHQKGALEAILHRETRVTECSAANIFIIKNGELWTHPANHFILNGITRQMILKVARENNISVYEQAFTVEELMDADEVFISSTTIEVTPIIAINDCFIGNGKRGPLTEQIHHLLVENIEQTCGPI